jgi:3-methylcrotonyl-CoA carboxylase alpha subunit
MFNRILIANRGEIARRVIRAARGLGIETVAVYSDADAASAHVSDADHAVRIGPAPARESYLRTEAILDAARRTGAEAIHPGYGFLSENAAFADACDAAGIVFIGPPAAAIRAMGSKAEAKALMGAAGVPLTPGYHGADQDPATLRAAADDIGYPVLIKASAGGGGKGMRLVEAASEFDAALASCRREAEASFGDDRVLVERFVTRPRHIEMQVFADAHGNAVHLFERDCSIQRRHQKVVEEAPAPGMPEALRAEMGAAAVAAAKAVDYRGAGTVEFIAESKRDGTPGAFFFMEMNTRLQVEHPVTEAITGQDLVEWQFRVAAGEPLPLAQEDITATGHAIEVRLYAEDPDSGFLPSIGRLDHLRFPAPETARVDTGVRSGDEISPHYDPMIAKLIAHGDDRDTARRRLVAALGDTEIAGIASNRDFLIRVLRHPDFAAATLDTGFISAREQTLLPARGAADREALVLAMLVFLDGLADDARAAARALGDSNSPWADARGWRMNDRGAVTAVFRDAEGERILTAEADGAAWRLSLDGEAARARRRAGTGHDVVADIDGRRVAATVVRTGERFTVIGATRATVLDRVDPLRAAGAADAAEHAVSAPMPGKITALHVAIGDTVEEGQALMVLEAMKMEHTIKAPASATIGALPFAVGDQVTEGATLVGFEEETA